MVRFFAPYKKFGIFLFVLSVIIITLIYNALKPKRVLRIYEPEQVNVELVDSTMQEIRKYHKIADFKLVNQHGDTITEQHYKDKIYVADFFFTTCQTICPKMTQNMGVLQQKLKNEQQVLLLSHTVMPEVDSVPQLKKYAVKKGVDKTKWNLVTGTKKELYDLARKSYLVAKAAPFSKYDLIHTENFVLVDQKRRIRGYYDGTDTKAMEQLLADIDLLLEKE
ncbi:SCO family protein [Aquimarina agarilytica]|uniref:SCO family protein n=1 Tax=Aquimarina agarilytica TaxID=1087449 RepID=UPI00058D03B3|nr:SCO family protein [Aquimarina agarilytica]